MKTTDSSTTAASIDDEPTLILEPKTRNTPHQGLYAKWERVDGKLTCKWLHMPD